MKIPGEENSTIYVTSSGGFGNPVPLEKDFPAPSHWIPYITVSNVDETCEQVKKSAERFVFQLLTFQQ
ncbi:VOC family protein [cf. Phormidesmis sp. LEGE 11477]|uniref:VOC family protein n=1 Tax=cf. Phormidesmis sp. LEGE 11477 TaxID=1828680 RepID=UPI001D14F7FF|nr:hypothetical protein [cf. Phormidesmis sp. LEGE 11477]